jgi:type IV pilus assembly protein PilE
MHTHNMINRLHRERGFTLVELMVTILVVSILVGIAVPTYTSSVQKSRRTDARNAVLDLAARQERYMSTANAYSSTGTDLGYAAGFPQAAGPYYNVSSTATAPAGLVGWTYTATATPPSTSPQYKDTVCRSLSVNQLGQRSSTDSGGADSTATCWPGN